MKVFLFFLKVCTLTYAVRFNCEFSTINHVHIGPRYSCSATVLDIDLAPNLTGVTGTHLFGFNNSNVEAVIINNQPGVTFIPQQMKLFFPKITAITLIFCGISSFSESELSEYIDLEFLNVPLNQIQRVPGNLFHHAPRMRFINFNNNQITRVGQNLIEPLFFLGQALFSGNPCINFSVTNSSMGCLIGLLRERCQDIELQHNTKILQH